MERIFRNEGSASMEEGKEVFTRCSLPLPLHLVGREEKLYALDSQVSGLSRRVIQTGVTAARFIVFVNLGRVTSRRGSGYHPPRRRTRHDVYAPPSPPPPPIHHRPRRLIPPLSSVLFRSVSTPPSGR